MRLERKISLVVTALAVGACNTEIKGVQTPIRPEIEPIRTSESIDFSQISTEVQMQAGDNFFDKMEQLIEHRDEELQNVALGFYAGMKEGNFIAYTTIPVIDSQGEVIEPPPDVQPVRCGFEESGFKIMVVSNIYYINEISPEATGALIYQCLVFQKGVNEKYKSFQKSNPQVTLNEALNQNPEWLVDASLEAWYQASGLLIAPYRDKIPKNDTLLWRLVNIHDRCKIDFSAHEDNPEKAERDKNCCMRKFMGIEIEEL